MAGIASLVVNALGGSIVKEVSSVAKEYINKEINIEEFESKVAERVADTLGNLGEAQADLLKTEATGHSWLQRNWRPVAASSFSFTLVYYALIAPQLNAWWGLPVGNPGDVLLGWMFTLTGGFGSVYSAGRTLEKIASVWTRK